MNVPPSLLLALLGGTSFLIYNYFMYPVFLSPLAKIPSAHWSCSFSRVWLLYLKWTNQENATMYEKHMTLGPTLRISPDEVSLNTFDEGLKKVYQGGFPKPQFYFNGFAIYGMHNIFTFLDNATHAARKRLVSNTFSKSYVLASPQARASTRDVLFGRYMPKVQAAAESGKPLEVLEMNYAYSLDTFVQWQFGKALGSNLLEDEKERRLYLDGFFAPYPYLFWMYYFPKLVSVLRKVGLRLIPAAVDIKFGAAESWNLAKCDQAQRMMASEEDLEGDNKPIIFEQALKSMSDPKASFEAYPQRMEIASDMFAHSSAAFETSGNTETYLMYEMCRNSEWQRKLRQELLTLDRPVVFDKTRQIQVTDLPESKDIDALPVLHAVIMETLRLWPAVPGGQPRVVPKTCSLGGYDDIPAGTIVQSYAYILHRTPEIFPNPHEWRPERWLESTPEQLAVMKRWFWAFGSGGRMCIGSNFAYYSMKFLVAAIYTNYSTSIYDHGSMELLDAYLAGPKGHRLEINFHSLDKSAAIA